MALFNKLFSSRKSCKGPDAACERVFVFTKDQARVVLFRECDFKDRKVLFDSKSVEKVALDETVGAYKASQKHASPPSNNQEKFVEVSNGYGYQYTKPCCDIAQVGEMVFGSVAMSYRGTFLKIHSLTTPPRLMCSQVFPSPRHPTRGCSSAPSQSYTRSSITSCQSLEHSIKLDDSGASSANSISDHLSVHSTGSDTLLVCRGSRSVPLDVPATNLGITLSNNNFTPSIVGDSGFSGEQSYNSISSGPQSLPVCFPNEGEQVFSCGSLYKRWLRSASTSLDHSLSSLTGSASADECLLKSHSRGSKLGLAVVIELPFGQEKALEQFLMEHVALIESMVWRTRQGAEIAYIRHNNFVSLMFEVVTNTVQWLVDLLSGPQLPTHMWISIAPICDKFNSISESDILKDSGEHSYSYSGNQSDTNRTMSLSNLDSKGASGTTIVFTNSSTSLSLNNSFHSDCTNSFDSSDTLDKSSDFTFLNLTKFLRTEWATINSKSSYSCSDKNVVAEKCVAELCELLECVDVKHTNFFVSTLLTAVLTHHLGWVATVLPPSSSDKEKVSKLHNPCNPLWGQLTDLYGALGHPTKMAHTIVTGTNKADLISKILNSLTYFIRCSDLERKCVTRLDMKDENRKVDCICQQKSCIPKENYKKYEDHLREMDISNGEHLEKQENKIFNRFKSSGAKSEAIEMSNLLQKKVEKHESAAIETSNLNVLKHNGPTLGLSKARTCLTDLNKISEESTTTKRLYPNLESICRDENVVLDNGVENGKDSFTLVDKVKNLGIQAVHPLPVENPKECEFTNSIINEKVRKLCRVPPSAVFYHTEPTEEQQLIDIKEASKEIMKIFAPKKVNMEKQTKSADFSFQSNEVPKTKAPIKSKSSNSFDEYDSGAKCNNVVFVLGDDEELVGLKKLTNNNLEKITNVTDNTCHKDESRVVIPRPTCFKTELRCENRNLFDISSNSSPDMPDKPDLFFKNSVFKDCDFSKCEDGNVKPSTSWTSLELECSGSSNCKNIEDNIKKEFARSQSVPPEKPQKNASSPTEKVKSKYRYSGVKFNFQQYPQIVTNYMRSKNLELSQLPFAEKNFKLTSLDDYRSFDFLKCDTHLEEVEILQTPSNASELEFTSDLAVESYEIQHAKEKIERKPKTFFRAHLPNTVVKEPSAENSLKKTCVIEHPLKINDKSNNAMFEQEENNSSEEDCFDADGQPQPNKMQIIELPVPKSQPHSLEITPINYTSSLMRGIGDRYISDMVLQGTSAPKSEWESSLRRDLSLATRHPLLDQPIDEAVAIVANTDTWEVQLLSSHTYVVDRGSSGIRVGMSQLVANMLESLLHMWKLHTPPEYCIMHIEQRLQEFCILSKSLSELLLATEFCSMDLLTSVLQLEVNDIPLLMAVASTHSPQVTQKYGLSFQ